MAPISIVTTSHFIKEAPMRHSCAIVMLFVSLFSLPAAAAPQPDLVAIQQVVQQFQSAIVAKDGPALAALFLPDNDSWLTVLDDATWAEARVRNPAARKVTASTKQAFIDFVGSSQKVLEERFTNVRIASNGAVASVYFDFDFLIDGAVTNRGAESWQLVRTESGWKIGAMLYSVGR